MCEHSKIILFFQNLARKHEGKEALRLSRRLENAVQIEGTEICALTFRHRASCILGQALFIY
jgi:hypothetical protein